MSPSLIFLLVLAGLALASAGVKGRDLLADRHLATYRRFLVEAHDPVAAAVAARTDLVEGTLAWREDHPEGLYHLGVHRANLGDYAGARESWREALRADPGMTEARLEIAHSYRREDRMEDARDALLEAARRDPTRFDVHMRLGHLALGKEPVPGERSGDDFDAVRAHGHYNAAEHVGPDRFEVPVARARIARRLGDLEEARAQLLAAEARVAKAPETLLESFRLAEVERRTTDLGVASILALSLLADRALGGLVEREAEDMLAEGRAREALARQAVKGTLQPPDYTSADRAYDAAALRFAGLMHARILQPGPALAAARMDEDARAWRAALTRLRAVLSWAVTAPPELGGSRIEWLRSLADAFERAARAATRTDAPLARYLFARAHATQGALLIEEKEWEAARGVLEKAVRASPHDANVRVDLARVLVRLHDPDGALHVLLEALEISREVAPRILHERDFEKLIANPALSNALR
jgi:tetratricopeptide (TPR) repeat protein